MCDRADAYETEHSLVGQSIPMWDIAVSSRTGKCHVGHTSLIWDRKVSCGSE